MHFERMEIIRMDGDSHVEAPLVREANLLTSRAFGASVPVEETYDHFRSANLRHLLYVNQPGQRWLAAYTLNHVYETQLSARRKLVNYFSSAFVHPDLQSRHGMYQFLASLRTTGEEDYLLVRTQNPSVISAFARFVVMRGYRLFTPLRQRIPREVCEVVQQQFGTDALIRPGEYGRCLTGTPIEPNTKLTRALMARMDVRRGDACVLVAKKMREADATALRSKLPVRLEPRLPERATLRPASPAWERDGASDMMLKNGAGGA